MNNKPVAWINKTGTHGYLEWDKDNGADESIPLYTHPHPDNLGLAESIIKQQQIEIEELKATMRSFFEDFLNVREESDNGRVFAPITIGCCRVMMTEPLSNLLDKMRKLSGAKPPPKPED